MGDAIRLIETEYYDLNIVARFDDASHGRATVRVRVESSPSRKRARQHFRKNDEKEAGLPNCFRLYGKGKYNCSIKESMHVNCRSPGKQVSMKIDVLVLRVIPKHI